MLFSTKREESNSLLDHLLKIKDIRDQLKPIERKMEEKDMVVITLKKLAFFPCKFIETLNNTITDKDLTFEQLSTKLLQQDRWKKQSGKSNVNESSEVVLAAKFKSNGNKHSNQNDGNKESAKSRKAIKFF